ncbi:MAG: cell division protein FtsZ, partial [Pseudomonadota bacterium]
YQGVKGVTDLMVRPGLINLDFADVRAVMDEMGKAMMGTGEGDGEDRAIQAAEKAIANPLLDEISLRGAKGVLINITGSHDLTLFELDEAANRIREEVDPDANIIVGSTLDTSMEGKMRVSVVATGIDAAKKEMEPPVARRTLAEPLAAPEDVAETLADEPVYAEVEPEVAQEPSLFEDDLPAPAYQPSAPRAERPAPGTPSAEALARLEAAVRKQPVRALEEPAQPAARAAEPMADEKRFGINSLIGRMTGQGEEAARPAERTQPRLTPRGPLGEDELSPEEERIEIPAFLRRQAN